MSEEKKIDYLEVDQNIPGQNYVCMSFLSPENLIQNREAFNTAKFLQSYCKEQNLKFEEVYDNNDILEKLGIQNEINVFRGSKYNVLKRYYDCCSKNKIDIVSQETDIFIIQALYRAYTFLTSAYLLEPSNRNKTDGKYGVGRNILPPQITQPLEWVSSKLDVYPWLDYHYAYSLGNYVKKEFLNENKKKLLSSLIHKTERLVRKNPGLYKALFFRFVLNYKKIIS